MCAYSLPGTILVSQLYFCYPFCRLLNWKKWRGQRTHPEFIASKLWSQCSNLSCPTLEPQHNILPFSFLTKTSENGWCLLFCKNTNVTGVHWKWHRTGWGLVKGRSSAIKSLKIRWGQIVQNFLVYSKDFIEVGLCAYFIQFLLALLVLKLMKPKLQGSSILWIPVFPRNCCEV